MDFSDDSNDLDEFEALERQIRAEPPEELEQFAALFKSQGKSSRVQEENQNDAFGDIRLDFEYEAPAEPIEQEAQPIRRIEEPEFPQPVRLNKASEDVLKKRLDQKAAQDDVRDASGEHDFDQQLKQLEIEINKYKQMEAQIELDKRNLHLDYDAEFRQLEEDKQSFSKFKKEKEAEFKREKEIIDEARSSRQLKDREQETVEKQNEELLEQCAQLKADLKRQEQTSRLQIETVKLANEKLIQENNDLMARATSEDKQILQLKQADAAFKKQITAKDEKIDDLNTEIREISMNLKETQIRLEERGKLLEQPKEQDQREPEAASTYDQLFDAEEPHKKVNSQSKSVAADGLIKKTIKELRQNDVEKPPEIVEKAAPKSGPQIDRKQFTNIPFFEVQELFDEFNRDVDEFIDKSEIQQSRKLTDREEFVYSSGARRFIFNNGTEKIVLPSGVTDIEFDNGDIKRVDTNSQTSVYFYADVGTLFTQLQSTAGVIKVYRFSNDQMEKHYEDGRKVVYYPDGTMKYVYADGTEKAVFPDGEVVYN